MGIVIRWMIEEFLKSHRMTHLLARFEKFFGSFAISILHTQNKSSSNNKGFAFDVSSRMFACLLLFLEFLFRSLWEGNEFLPHHSHCQRKSAVVCIQQSKKEFSCSLESTLGIPVYFKFSAISRFKDTSINHEQTSHEKKVNIPRVPDLKSAAGNVNSIKSTIPSEAHVPQQFLTLFAHRNFQCDLNSFSFPSRQLRLLLCQRGSFQA